MPFGEPSAEGFARDRAWRERAARKYAERQRTNAARKGLSRAPRERPATDTPPRPRRRAPRRNDAPWRAECEAAYGSVCIVPGCGSRAIEMDHIKPRSQGGQSVVENGLPLCGEFSTNRHHPAKTAGTLKFDWAWLTPAQRTYLAKIGWVDWDEDGKPFGEGWRHFTERGPHD